ncbi:JmjC domain-containing protein [Streptomyces sp. NPDC018964]|uniref:JmjC domain-containing protein n=1 Tax=Streptomyces sp. NPDC018964 TaxID=3365058 RepID=UPI003796912B
MPLSDLVPDAAELLDDWPTEPRTYQHGARAFEDLLTMAEIDALIDHDCLPNRNVRLIRDGETVDDREYSATPDMPDPGAVRRYLDDGCSLSIRRLQTIKPSLSVLRREVARETGYETHFNAYLTPPRQHGLRYHFDPYVTLVIQIHGSKTWPLHQPFVDNPVEEYENFRRRGFTPSERAYLATTAPAQEITLNAGDVLWLPRGWVHSPHNRDGDEPSPHLTFALKQRTLHWAAEEIAGVLTRHLLGDTEARDGIPPTRLLDSPEAVVKDVREILVGALLTMDTEEMAATLRRAALTEEPLPAPRLRYGLRP